MSIIIEKAGILDTLQDAGRYGFAHLGVNVNGPMDWQSHQLANALVGNSLHETIVESHFPAPVLHFKTASMIAMCGADFNAQLDGKYLPINRTIIIPAESLIKFTKKISGERLYIAVHGGFAMQKVMGSTATNVKAAFGGLHGGALRKGDELVCKHILQKVILDVQIMPWFVPAALHTKNVIRVIQGPEWSQLSAASATLVTKELFVIQPQSDRMAIRLESHPLALKLENEMISSPVLMGTVQLLPNGQLLALMADCQTVGGYPRILQVILADLPKLAQMQAASVFTFQLVDMQTANAASRQATNNVQLQANAICFRLQTV